MLTTRLLKKSLKVSLKDFGNVETTRTGCVTSMLNLVPVLLSISKVLFSLNTTSDKHCSNGSARFNGANMTRNRCGRICDGCSHCRPQKSPCQPPRSSTSASCQLQRQVRASQTVQGCVWITTPSPGKSVLCSSWQPHL